MNRRIDMSSNLPPGCSSADGGIDHAFEAAIESLIDAIETPEEAYALRVVLPGLRTAIDSAYRDGRQEGEMVAGMHE